MIDPLYHFAHRALQRPLLADAGYFEGLIGNQQKQTEWLLAAGQQTAKLTGLKPEHGEALAGFCAVYDGDILGRPALIVALPEPQMPTHCHFIAVFRAAGGTLRYFTLERSSAPGQTMLCRWSRDGRHSLIGTGPKPDVAAFGDAIEAIERKRDAEIAWQPEIGSSTTFLPMNYFPQEALQYPLQQDPSLFEKLLADARERARWIDFGMEAAQSFCRMPASIADAMRRRVKVHSSTIAGCPALIVEMPPAQHAADCYFLAILRRQSGELRYYALERGTTSDKTMLCFRRADRAHAFIGDGPPPERAAFRDAVDETERQANGGNPPSRAFPEGCPFHI